MERKIGEIFEYNGEWYQCLPERICDDCAFKNNITCKNSKGIRGECQRASRQKDGVIFKKLEKYGEPYISSRNKKRYQLYRCFCLPIITKDRRIEIGDANWVGIEIKQNKEDMKEKKLNLKPFDIQKAREGKPVCTRDGRKARIICYDRQSDHGFPIVALVENTGAEKDEDVHFYRTNGTAATVERAQDLMMLSEKKEGWINVYALNTCYSSKEEAEANIDQDYEHEYIRTVKIEWEE